MAVYGELNCTVQVDINIDLVLVRREDGVQGLYLTLLDPLQGTAPRQHGGARSEPQGNEAQVEEQRVHHIQVKGQETEA